MENIQQDDTIKFFIIISLIFGAFNGYVQLMKYVDEKRIAREKLAHYKKTGQKV